MFFPDLGFAPAPRTVKLGDYRWLVFNTNLVNTVLVAVEGKQASTDHKSGVFQGIKNGIGGKGVVRMAGGFGHK